MEEIEEYPLLIEYFIDFIDFTLYNNISYTSISLNKSYSSISNSISSSSFIYSQQTFNSSFPSFDSHSSSSLSLPSPSSSLSSQQTSHSSKQTSSSSSNSSNFSSSLNYFSSFILFNNLIYTKFKFKFYFNSFNFIKCENFQKILLENNFFHTILCPIIYFNRKRILNKNLIQFNSFNYNQNDDNIFNSISKEERNTNEIIILIYELNLCGIVITLEKFYNLTNCFERNEINYPNNNSQNNDNYNNYNILNQLVTNEFSKFKSFLLLLLMMARELNEIHSEGLCHFHLQLNSFHLYTPSLNFNDNDNNSSQWGVQLLQHWLFLPSGPNVDSSYSFHNLHQSNNSNNNETLPPKILFLNIQTDIFYLGGIFIEMALCWIIKSLQLLQQQRVDLSPEILELLTLSQFQSILLDCTSSNKCSNQFITLLDTTFSILYPTQPKQIIEQFIILCNSLIHIDSFERYDCFYIEEVLTEIIDLFE